MENLKINIRIKKKKSLRKIKNCFRISRMRGLHIITMTLNSILHLIFNNNNNIFALLYNNNFREFTFYI